MAHVEWSKKQPSLCQIYSRGLEMCLVGRDEKTGGYVQACDFVLCKDFFQDAIQATLIGQARQIYGFKYDPKTDPALSVDRTRIAVANAQDKSLGEKVAGAVDFLNQFEKRMRLLRTTAVTCDSAPAKYKDNSGVYLFTGSGRWMLSPPMISLYTLLLRIGFVHTAGKSFDETVKEVSDGTLKPYTCGTSGSNDNTYLKGALPGIEKILKHGYRKVFHLNQKDNYRAEVGVGTMHNHCGIVGFSSGYCKDYFPHWFRLDTAKPKKLAVRAKKTKVDAIAA